MSHDLIGEIQADAEALQEQLPQAALAPLFEERSRGIAPGAPGRAAWLTHAGEAWELCGDLLRARACYEEAARDGGETYLDPRAEMLDVLFELGETSRVDEVLAELRRDLKAGWEGRFVHELVGESLELHGRLEEAHRWFSAGLTRARRTGRENLDVGCLNGRYRVRRALDLPEDRYDVLARERLRDYAAEVDRADESRLLGAPADLAPRPMTVLYWPAGELDEVLQRWPSLAGLVGADDAAHRSVVEHRLRVLSGDHRALFVSAGTLEEYLRFAAEREHDASESSTRAAYAAHLGYLRRTVRWPPERNEPCWCGSALSYARCCGGLR